LGLQVLHFGLFIGFAVWVFGSSGLDMRVCWVFLKPEVSLRLQAKKLRQ
jgi:hypothetical protein